MWYNIVADVCLAIGDVYQVVLTIVHIRRSRTKYFFFFLLQSMFAVVSFVSCCCYSFVDGIICLSLVVGIIR